MASGPPQWGQSVAGVPCPLAAPPDGLCDWAGVGADFDGVRAQVMHGQGRTGGRGDSLHNLQRQRRRDSTLLASPRAVGEQLEGSCVGLGHHDWQFQAIEFREPIKENPRITQVACGRFGDAWWVTVDKPQEPDVARIPVALKQLIQRHVVG